MRVAVLLVFGLGAFAQDFQQRGYVDLRTSYFPQTAANDSGRVIADALLRYEASAKLTPWLKLNGALSKFRIDVSLRLGTRPSW